MALLLAHYASLGAQDVSYVVKGGKLNYLGCNNEDIVVNVQGTMTLSFKQSLRTVTCRMRNVNLFDTDDKNLSVTGAGTFFVSINGDSEDGLPGNGGVDLIVTVREAQICLTSELYLVTTFPRVAFTVLPVCGTGGGCGSAALIGIVADPSDEDASRFFRRGDVNGDVNRDITDAVVLLNNLFRGGDPVPCEDAADTNDNGRLDLSDAVLLLTSLFAGSGELPLPARLCGLDPTDDDLDCGGQSACMPE